MIQIIELITTITATSKNETLVPVAFSSLKEISVTICSGEEGALTESLPPILVAMKNPHFSAAAISVLPPLW
jgi:U3 small nucleolar RNA-associated protein 10